MIAGAGSALAGSALAKSMLESTTVSDDGAGLAALAARSHLPFGAFVAGESLNDRQFVNALRNNCNLIAPMNDLKRRAIEVAPGRYNFTRADRMLKWATQAKMAVHGHTLIWYKADPPWLIEQLEKKADGKLLTDYVSRVAGHCAGRVRSWDVVNESIRPEDGRKDGLRDNIWVNAFGEQYIDMAFHAARRADPNALLLFSDYGLETDHPVAERRRKAALGLLERALARGAPIGGVGLHGHIRRYGFPYRSKVLRPFLDELRGMGLKIMVTEFDVADWNGPFDTSQRDDEVAQLARDFTELVFSYDNLDAFICFGISDRYSWLNKEKPLLWIPQVRGLPLDSDMRRKPMWTAIAHSLQTRGT